MIQRNIHAQDDTAQGKTRAGLKFTAWAGRSPTGQGMAS